MVVVKKGKLKKETEGLITAAQDQALRTNSIKNMIDKQQFSRKSTIKARGMIK